MLIQRLMRRETQKKIKEKKRGNQNQERKEKSRLLKTKSEWLPRGKSRII